MVIISCYGWNKFNFILFLLYYSEQEIKETNELMSIGKRHLICNEPEKALDFFVELCERL